MEVIINL